MTLPVISDAAIEWLIQLPKLVDDSGWRIRLLPPDPAGFDCRSSFDLGHVAEHGPVAGTLHLFTRRNLNPNVIGDWSVGLGYQDYAGNNYRLIRCNGPHPADHTNRLEGDHIVRTAHIHRLTERYQRRFPNKPKTHEGYAQPTDAYNTPAEALNHLTVLANLAPSGMLWL